MSREEHAKSGLGPQPTGFELRNTQKYAKEQSCSESLFAHFRAFRSFPKTYLL
jgi:hypothetical protein